MVPPSRPSRRAILAGVSAGFATAFAGCSGSETHESSPDGGTLVTDHTVAMARSTSDQPPIVGSRETTGNAGNADEPSPTPEPLSLHAVESESDAEALAFAEDATNVAAVRRLVAETAYASESVLLYQTRVGECHRLQLNYVARDGDDGDPDVEFCQVIRDAEVDCEREARDYVAAAVRLPFPGEEYSGFSGGGGGSCGPIPERYRTESESA
ncbi:hypothetical protein [Halomicrobium salinisoli]|uniref:hypothetical protein n=1 Tax=Halomicrobium salinisoli TaxID=2878391 RepID=UPI001CF01EAB|nr:hypothetical protein [Halomicrobium salinisoli]